MPIVKVVVRLSLVPFSFSPRPVNRSHVSPTGLKHDQPGRAHEAGAGQARGHGHQPRPRRVDPPGALLPSSYMHGGDEPLADESRSHRHTMASRSRSCSSRLGREECWRRRREQEGKKGGRQAVPRTLSPSLLPYHHRVPCIIAYRNCVSWTRAGLSGPQRASAVAYSLSSCSCLILERA